MTSLRARVVGPYDFLIALIPRLAQGAPRVLDYGCGKGQLVAKGVEAGIDIWGSDTFADGFYQTWKAEAQADAGERIREIADDGTLPFPDAHFDVVIANMVFEHIGAPERPLEEIVRVLKPGGRLVALFPTYETWFEGHVGLYFPHWLAKRPSLQLRYLAFCHALGLGYYRGHSSRAEWARNARATMEDHVVYHRDRDLRALWRDAFGREPESFGSTYVAMRMPPLARLPSWVRAAICKRRVGVVWVATK